MDRPSVSALWGHLREGLVRCRAVVLVLAVGLILLLLPLGGERESQEIVTKPDETTELVERLEQKMADALSEIDGAGKVKVVLTVQSGTRQVLAQDSKLSGPAGERSQTLDTVVLSKGSGKQETVTLEERSPQFRGALVICHGGNDASVRLRMTEAVSALTGLGTDKIVICKGN